MIRIKICGITRLEDALLAAELGASAIGFIFYEKSPRYLLPEAARAIRLKLPPFVSTVGVFVNESQEKIKEIKDLVGLDYVQLHGEESPEVCEEFFPHVIKAVRVKDESDLLKIPPYQGKVSAILLDTYVKGLPGGTGKAFNWELAKEAQKFGLPIILAGGLNPENISQAREQAAPYALDVSSGIEASPGVKDHFLMKELFRKIFR